MSTSPIKTSMRRRRDPGFSLLEVVIALAICAFALFGLVSVMTYTTRSNLAHQERMIAQRACEMQIEKMLNTSFGSLLTQYSKYSSLITTPPSAINALDVPGLTYQPQGPTYGNGQIMFIDFPCLDAAQTNVPGNSGFNPGAVYETATTAFLNLAPGTTLDLDGDGATGSGLNMAGTCVILPCQIKVLWNGVYGKTQVVYQYIFRKP